MALWEKWLGWRDKLLADPRFHAFATRFPLTRPIVKHRASEVFDLCAGFVYSQILFAVVELNVLETLRGGPMGFARLAETIGLPLQPAKRLIEASTSLKLTEQRGDDLIGLGIHGAALLGNPGAIAMVKHHRLLYADLADPVGLLRDMMKPTELSRYWAYAQSDAPGRLPSGDVAEYSSLMDASQSLVAGDILDAYPLSHHRKLADVGGGEGAFILEALKRNPNLHATLFDLPAVAGRASAKIAATPFAPRFAAMGGSFLADPLPQGVDVLSLIRVVHDHDDDHVKTLLAAAHQALAPGGVILIGEPMADAPGAPRVGGYFTFYLLAMRRGRPRTAAELGHMLRAAGFETPRQIATNRPLLASVITARKSAAHVKT